MRFVVTAGEILFGAALLYLGYLAIKWSVGKWRAKKREKINAQNKIYDPNYDPLSELLNGNSGGDISSKDVFNCILKECEDFNKWKKKSGVVDYTEDWEVIWTHKKSGFVVKTYIASYQYDSIKSFSYSAHLGENKLLAFDKKEIRKIHEKLNDTFQNQKEIEAAIQKKNDLKTLAEKFKSAKNEKEVFDIMEETQPDQRISE